MLGRISTRNYKNTALYPLQADIKDRSQLYNYLLFISAMIVFFIKQINGGGGGGGSGIDYIILVSQGGGWVLITVDYGGGRW